MPIYFLSELTGTGYERDVMGRGNLVGTEDGELGRYGHGAIFDNGWGNTEG